jgi:type II secretory pathway component PulK
MLSAAKHLAIAGEITSRRGTDLPSAAQILRCAQDDRRATGGRAANPQSAILSPRTSIRGRNPQSGTVLIVTLWVVLVLAGLALVFARSMRVAAAVSANHVASLQAECIAGGALQYVVAKITEGLELLGTDAAAYFEAMPVGEEGFFWVLQSNLESDQELTYGLTDEAGKINLNSASEEMLLNLPGMTAELAASIIDWRDTDSDVTTGGAEDEYYLLQATPYNCKNGPLETVHEILLIKGASEELLYGEDTNLNGILDPQENDGDESDPPDNADGRLDRGFYDYVTVYSTESNVDAEGNTRINITDASAISDLQTLLQETFKEERALEIVMNSGISSSQSFSSILQFYYRSRMTFEEFSAIADKLTTSSETTLPGLVNVNRAPQEVLMCLPGLEEADVEALLDYRSTNFSSEEPNSIAWVTEVLDQTKATGIGAYITVHSNQYSADIVALSANGRAYQRYKAVIDTQGTPRVVYWRTLTHFGCPLDARMVAALRKGEPLTDAISSTRTY